MKSGARCQEVEASVEDWGGGGADGSPELRQQSREMVGQQRVSYSGGSPSKDSYEY